jgi:hypothetical protein
MVLKFDLSIFYINLRKEESSTLGVELFLVYKAVSYFLRKTHY